MVKLSVNCQTGI